MNPLARTGTRHRQQTTSTNRWLVLAVILTAVFMQLLDTTITMVAVPSIQNSLHSSYGEIQLVVAGYMLGFACVLVTGGRLGDTYGRKRMFLWGMLGFTIASAVCGAAPNALTLICARVVQGMCSGLMFPQVLGIIQVVFSGVQRPKAIGLYGATIGLATILGPVTGGALIQANIAGAGWRSIFYVNVPIGLAALALGAVLIPESKAAASRVDLPGAALLGTGLFLLVLPLVIGRDEGWPAWSLACVAVSPFVLAAFARYEHRRTRENENPLIDTGLFRQRPFSLGLAASLVFFTGIPSFFMILLLTLQQGLGYSPVKAGAAAKPRVTAPGGRQEARQPRPHRRLRADDRRPARRHGRHVLGGHRPAGLAAAAADVHRGRGRRLLHRAGHQRCAGRHPVQGRWRRLRRAGDRPAGRRGARHCGRGHHLLRAAWPERRHLVGLRAARSPRRPRRREGPG